MNKIKEADILDKAKLTLEDVFKDELTLRDKNWTSNGDKGIDGHLLFNGVEFPFIVFTQATTGQVVKSVKKLPKEKNILFILDYAKPEMMHFFKENNLFFVDTAGNCYVNLPNFKIMIDGRKNVFGKLPDTKIAFQKTGLKLIYQLLIEPELASENYRTIASKTGVSLASVNNIFEELKEDNFIIEVNHKKRNLYRVERLVTKWAINYTDILRPKIHRGYFRPLTPKTDVSKNILAEKNGQIYIGGQLAAQHLNGQIIASTSALFSNIRLSKMVEKYHIIPTQSTTQDANIEVLEVFWNENPADNPAKNHLLTDPVLIYAELLNSNNFRSVEAAQHILENEIRDKFIGYKLHW